MPRGADDSVLHPPPEGTRVIDFQLTEEQCALRDRTVAFVRDKLIPLEHTGEPTRVDDDFRRELVALGHEAGLVAPHSPTKWGGLGLDHVSMSEVFIASGYSLLGPLAMNCFAPDEGNMNLLSKVATPEQQERWLRPLIAGEIRSCFAMTEPAPGAGSDPRAMQTTVTRDGDEYVVNGTKWLITGANGASFVIIMARVADDDSGRQATMLLADMDTPGISIEREVATLDRSFPGGHPFVRFDDVRIPAENVLGEPGQGFAYAQVRLAPARLTHCMRWLGAAIRAHDIATAHANERNAFGKKLIEHEGVGFMLADNEIDIQQCRLSIWHTAWLLDQGEAAGRESSMTKVLCSEATDRIVDRSQQILGGLGFTHETAVGQIATEVRAFRIYDGPSEVHRWSIARQLGRR